MNKSDIISYIEVKEKVKVIIGNRHNGWNDDLFDIIDINMKDDIVFIKYRCLIDDYNGNWYYYNIEMAVEDFCR